MMEDIEIEEKTEVKKQQTVYEETSNFFQCFIDIKDWWNELPYIRHVVTLINAITLIVSYTCWPGIISSVYLAILMVICIILIIIKLFFKIHFLLFYK